MPKTPVAISSKSTKGLRRLILDLDWYGWTGFQLEQAISVFPSLAAKFVVRKIPRAKLFSTIRKSNDSETPESLSAMKTLCYRNLNLWSICQVSIIKELGYNPKEPLSSVEDSLIRQYFRWARDCIDAVEALFDRTSPDAILVFQGGFFDSRSAVECARRRGIRSIAVETSFIGNYVFLDSLCGLICNRHSLAVFHRALYESYSIAPEFDPFNFWKQSLSKKHRYHKTGNLPFSSLNIPPGKRNILILSQVATDAAIVLDSPIFESPAELVRSLKRIADDNQDWHLIVRLHPKESACIDDSADPRGPGQRLWHNTLTALQRLGLTQSDNISVITDRDVDTFDLIQHSDVGVTINSQAGLEMALWGKPLIVTGRCFYSGCGFTVDATRQHELGPALKQALESGLSLGQRERLREFCNYLFGHYLIPLDQDLMKTRQRRMEEVLLD